MARDPRKSPRNLNPMIAWIVIGGLLAIVVALLAAYTLRPGRSPAENAQTAAAIEDMDAAQNQADERRNEKRSAAALLN